MFNYFTFDGVPSTEYNCYVAQSNMFDAPKKDIKTVQVLGRNGNLHIDNGRYESFRLKLLCYIPDNMQTTIDDIRNFLLSKGTARYTEALRPNEYRNAIFIEAFEVKGSDRRGAYFNLVFDASPERYLYEGEVPVSVENINSTRTGTLISIEDTENTTSITDAKAELEPKVYHDYDSVWLPGYGKNKLKTTATEETVNGLTFSPNDDGTIEVGGTSSEALTVSTDSEIYSKRVVENGYRIFDEIVGGSVVWNQIANNLRAPTSINGLTITASADGFTINGTASAATDMRGWFNLTPTDSPYLNASGHKVLVSFTLVSGSVSSASAVYFNFGGSTGNVLSGTPRILTPTIVSSSTNSVHVNNGTVLTNAKYRLQITDLTSLFGNSTIADYIYNLEQSSSGSGVALFKKLFPLDYYAYNSGTIMSVCTSQHKLSNGNGFNTYTLSPLTLRGIPKLVDNKIVYDGDIYKASGEVTRRYGEVDLGTLNWAVKTNTTSIGNYFYADSRQFPQGNVKFVWPWGSNPYPLLCTKYNSVTRTPTAFVDKSITVDGVISIELVSQIQIKDSSYTDAAAFKTAMRGVKLVYELATPTAESTTSYTKPQICEQGGTEEYVDNEVTQGNRDVSIPVGHNTFYADYVVSDEAKLAESETYNVSSNLTVGYRDSSGMHTVTNSLTIPSGGEYEFAAYTGDGASIEPMISTSSATPFEPYENIGYLEEYSSATLKIEPKNIYTLENGMAYDSGLFIQINDGEVRLTGNATSRTRHDLGNVVNVTGTYIASGGIAEGNSKLIVRKINTVMGHSTVTDYDIYTEDVTIPVSRLGTTTLQFYLDIANNSGDGLVFNPMLRNPLITDSAFEKGVDGSRAELCLFDPAATGGEYSFYRRTLTETHKAIDISTLTWSIATTRGELTVFTASLPSTADVTANISQHMCTGMTVAYGLQSNAQEAKLTIYKSGNAQSSVVYLAYKTSEVPDVATLTGLIDGIYLNYKLYTPVSTNYGPEGAIYPITNATTYFYSPYQPSDLSSIVDYHELEISYTSPTAIENPTGMKAYPLIQIVPTDGTDGYVRINGATIFVKMNGVLNHGVYFFDTEIQDAYYGDYENANQWIYTLDSSIFFKEGKNVVTFENVDRVVIYPRWWKL